MRFTSVFFLLILILVFPASNLYSQNLDYAKSIVNTLASEDYMGRGYTKKADLKAANFIKDEFRRYGIQPINSEYFRYFNLDVNTFPGKMEISLNGQKLRPGIDYLTDPSSPSLKGSFEVIRIRRQDLNKPDVLSEILMATAGKALMIDMNDTVKFSPSESEKISKLVDAIKYDPELKNPLTIILSDKKLTWGISGRQAKKAVVTLHSGELNPDDISFIEVDIKARLQRNYKTQNVIGIIPGKTVPDSFLVVTAHYDHLGIMGKETCFTGANDNASGIAMLLNLAKYFAENPPKYTLVLIALSAEELGLLGAASISNDPGLETGKIRFLVNFDMAGTGEEGIMVVNATVFKEEFERLQQLNSTESLLPSVRSRGEACISDHCIFYMKKVPCFYIYTLGGITAYHDIFDRAETLPLSAFDNYLKLMISFFETF